MGWRVVLSCVQEVLTEDAGKEVEAYILLSVRDTRDRSMVPVGGELLSALIQNEAWYGWALTGIPHQPVQIVNKRQ